MTDDPMTDAELRVVREHLALPVGWLAKHLGVAERTIHRWEHGHQTIPDGIRREVEHLEALTAQAVDAGIEAYQDMRDPTEVPLVTYRTDEDYRAHEPDAGWPASWHRRVCARVANEVPGLTIAYRTDVEA